MLAFRLFVDPTLGALSSYANYPQAFGVIDRARELLLDALAFATAQNHHELERRDADLHAALASREIIGRAEGLLIERERIAAEQAFTMLASGVPASEPKLRDVAQTLVDNGEARDTGPFRH